MKYKDFEISEEAIVVLAVGAILFCGVLGSVIAEIIKVWK